MMVTSSLCCSEFYILYIDLPCAHYTGDVTMIQYIVYSMLKVLYTAYRTLVVLRATHICILTPTLSVSLNYNIILYLH